MTQGGCSCSDGDRKGVVAMGLLRGLFRARGEPQDRTSGSAYSFFLGNSTSGKRVNERTSMQMTAVYSCVRILSETNGLGIIRHFVFYNKDFFQKHPEIGIEKKYGSPDKDKSVHDTSLLIPTLQDYFHTKPECKDYTLNEDEIKTKAVFSLYKCVHFLNTFQLLATLTFLSVSPSQ